MKWLLSTKFAIYKPIDYWIG